MRAITLKFLVITIVILNSLLAYASDPILNEEQNIINRKVLTELIAQHKSSKNTNNEFLCYLYEKLGDIETSFELDKKFTNIRKNTALGSYRNALYACSSNEVTSAALSRIYNKYLDLYENKYDPNKAVYKHISIVSGSRIDTKSAEKINNIFLERLTKSKMTDDVVFSYAAGMILDEYNIYKKESSLLSSPDNRSELTSKIKKSFYQIVNPKQNAPLELGIILFTWTILFFVIYFYKKYLYGQPKFSAYSTFSLWQKSEWGDQDRELEIDKNSQVILSNTDGKKAVFKKFICDKNDILFSGFILNETIPLTFVVFITTLLGFGLLYALNAIEGTLNEAMFVSLTFMKCVADPINWGILFPLVMVLSRLFYEYIAHSMNAFYENLLSKNEKDQLLEIIDRFYSFLDYKMFYWGIFILSFVFGAVSYITYGNKIDVYGMMYYSIPYYDIGIVKIPTITGYYVITILTILIYTILINTKNVLTTIFLLNYIYKKFFHIIKVNPFHQDGCGGFSFIGKLSLKMSLVVLVSGLMGVTLLLKDTYIAKNPEQIYYWIIFPAYLIVLPIVFMIPILDARKVLVAIRDAYKKRLSLIGIQIRNEMFEFIDREHNHKDIPTTPRFYESLSNFKLLCQNDIPTWPIRIQPVFGFITAFIIPALAPVIFEKLIS
jgi:hypothetical protein